MENEVANGDFGSRGTTRMGNIMALFLFLDRIGHIDR